jgi:hypothetical protein
MYVKQCDCLKPCSWTTTVVDDRTSFIHYTFLSASTECSAGSNDHFVVVGGGGAVPSLVQFDGMPLGGANFQY